jgi:hypothetical protein
MAEPTGNTAIRVSELDFDGIKENLKTYLRSQSEFQDFDFEGSGIGVLLDILAYNTHYMGYYLNVVANEMFLDTAQLRNSVLSHAKMIGYTPRSKNGAKTQITVVATPSLVEDNDASSLTLGKYTRFLGEDIDGINYNFVTTNANTVSKSNGSFTFANVWIRQGEVIQQQYLMEPTNVKRSFNIPSANVDTETLTISVQQSSSNTETFEYILASDITETNSNSRVFFLEENADVGYTFYFGDNYIGKRPDNGSIVIATYLDTMGSEANGIINFAAVDPIGNTYSDNVSVTATNRAAQGTDGETLEQIRFRAPYYYTTQNRAVTKLDYESLLTKDYPNLEAVSVWGGEENDPPIYGKVFISLRPRGNYTITEIDKERIKNTLIENRNIVTVIPEIIDPEYAYTILQLKVTYNPNRTALDENTIKEYVRAAVIDYKDRELEKFSSIFRKSKLQRYIEAAEKSITGSDLTFYMQKRQLITLNETKTYVLDFNTPLRKGDFNVKLFSMPQVRVTDIENVSRNVYIEEVPQTFTGVDSITVLNSGRDYLEPPIVTITGDGTGATAEAIIVGGKVDRIVVKNRGINYTRATVSITGGFGVEATGIVNLQAKNGNLRTYYFKTNGEKIIVNSNCGTIDYNSGRVVISSLLTDYVLENSFYSLNYLTISVPVANENLYPKRNRILTLDVNDPNAIQIEMVPEYNGF